MTHDCSDALKHLVDYLEGDLSDTDEHELEEHFQHCSPCMRFLESYRSTGQICKKAIEREMPTSMKKRLLDYLRDKTQTQA
ncbi:MAG: anti-sigma factor family protein [Myxococcota bacterium]